MNITDRISKTIKKIALEKNRPEDEVSWKDIAVEQAIELNDLFALREVAGSGKACSHKSDTEKMSYLKFFEFCEEQTAKGVKQTQCPNCQKWYWPSEL